MDRISRAYITLSRFIDSILGICLVLLLLIFWSLAGLLWHWANKHYVKVYSQSQQVPTFSPSGLRRAEKYRRWAKGLFVPLNKAFQVGLSYINPRRDSN